MPRIAVITAAELARSHGTGAQLLKILEGVDFHHFYFDVWHNTISEVPQSTLLIDKLPLTRGVRGIVRRIRRLIGVQLWEGNRVNKRVFGRILKRVGGSFDVAYVVIASEEAAEKAKSLLNCLRIPYVVHVMDILHPDGLNPRKMPAFRHVVAHARHVFALVPAIAEELRKLDEVCVEEVAIGKSTDCPLASPPASDKPIRVVTVGRPYLDGCRMLARAIPLLMARGVHMEIIYFGPHFGDLPEELRAHAKNGGYLRNPEQYHDALASCHLGFLSGPEKLDQFGRFSFPSRTVDYLMSGLPIVGCVAKKSATERVLEPITPLCVRTAGSEHDMADAIAGFVNCGTWRRASDSARAFAVERMGIDNVRKQILRTFDIESEQVTPLTAVVA